MLPLLLTGCNLTLGPKVETDVVIVKPGAGIVCLENKTVKARLLKQDASEAQRFFKQNVGGWVMMHPEHWEKVQGQFQQQADTIAKQNATIIELRNKVAQYQLK